MTRYDDFQSPPSPFDKTDRAILTELQGHGRTANVDLAEKVRLSPSACLRRTKALEEAGLITGYRAELDRTGVGLGLTVFISLKVEQHSRATSRLIEDALTAIPAVVACYVVSGEADFLVEAVVPDLGTYEGAVAGPGARHRTGHRRPQHVRHPHRAQPRAAAAAAVAAHGRPSTKGPGDSVERYRADGDHTPVAAAAVA